MENDLEAVRTT